MGGGSHIFEPQKRGVHKILDRFRGGGGHYRIVYRL